MTLRFFFAALLAIMTTPAQGAVKAGPQAMPSIFRIGAVGSLFLIEPEGPYVNADDKDKRSGMVLIMGSLGKRTFSIEAGVGILKSAVIVEQGSDKYLANSTYAATPVWMKWNYIERPLSTFFMKVGVLPLSKISQFTATEFAQVDEQSSFGVLGIGGTTDLGESTAFVLDISLFRNFADKSVGLLKVFGSVGFGFSYEI